MEINFDEYISEEEKREIIISEYRGLVRGKMHKENDLKRILSNVTFDVYYNIVDECFDGISKDILKEKVDKIIADPTSYNIFKKPDAWDRDSNTAYKYLQEVVTNNKGNIAKMVSDLLEEQTVKACKQDVEEMVKDVLIEHIRQF